MSRNSNQTGETVLRKRFRRMIQGRDLHIQSSARTKCIVYNGTGGRLIAVDKVDWRGYFNTNPDVIIENGQWSGFLHVKTTGAATGSCGAVIYRTPNNTDVFVGWQSPWDAATYNPSCYAESRGAGHWWANGSKGFMQSKVDNGPLSKTDTGLGYKVRSLSSGYLMWC